MAEQLPIILTGTWVQFGVGKDVPEEIRGLKGIVTIAPTVRKEGSEKKGSYSSHPHEVQKEDTIFHVVLRDSGATVQATRSMFAAMADTPTKLGKV